MLGIFSIFFLFRDTFHSVLLLDLLQQVVKNPSKTGRMTDGFDVPPQKKHQQSGMMTDE
jgi:hypothetical protein